VGLIEFDSARPEFAVFPFPVSPLSIIPYQLSISSPPFTQLQYFKEQIPFSGSCRALASATAAQVSALSLPYSFLIWMGIQVPLFKEARFIRAGR
jgi:hypothetical protein